MIKQIRWKPLIAALLSFSLLTGSVNLTYTATAHKKNWVQRHPTLTSVGAGVATHHMLKKSAARKKAHGQKLNWAERHPTLTAIGAGAATHHIIKKHTPK